MRRGVWLALLVGVLPTLVAAACLAVVAARS